MKPDDPADVHSGIVHQTAELFVLNGGHRAACLSQESYRHDERMGDIVWWEIVTPDPERFQEFHGGLWKWTFRIAFDGPESELGADYWLVSAGNRVIGGLQRAAQEDPRPAAGTRLYVEVADLESTLDQVIATGGRVERARTALGGDDRWFGTIIDPTGVSLGVWTSNPPPAG